MARISIDPTEIKKHPKFHSFRKKLDWQPHHAFGFLCAFWGEVANTEANESGDISDWTPDFLADRIPLNNVDPNRLWEALVPGYIEVRQNDRVFVRDWLEIFGPALRQKYHNTDRQKLIDTWSAYGRIYGRESKQNKPETAGLIQGSPPTSFSIEKETDAIEPENRRISGPESQSPPFPSPPSSEDLQAFISLRDDRKSSVGFSIPNEPEEKGEKNPGVRILQQLFHKKLVERLGEEPPNWDWGTAGKIFKTDLLPVSDVDTISARFAPWFKSTSSFIVNQSYCVKLLPTFFTALKNGPIANQVGGNGRKIYQDGYATAGSEKEFKD